MTRCAFRFHDGQRCQYPIDHAGIAHSWELYIEELIAAGRAAALEERDAEWRKAFGSYVLTGTEPMCRHCEGLLRDPLDPRSCEHCKPLRSLLNQGRDEVAPSPSRVSPEKPKDAK